MSGGKSNELLTWAVVAAVGAAAVVLWRAAVTADQAMPDLFAYSGRLAFAAVVTAGSVILVGLALRLEQASSSSIGLTSPAKGLGLGALWAAVPAVVAVAGAVLLGAAQVAAPSPLGEAVGRILILTALVLLAEALPEELIFRGFLQSRLTAVTGPWGGVLLQAALFTLFAYLIGAARDPMQLGFIAGFGVALGVLRAATGTAWAAVGFHLVFIALQQSTGWGLGWLSMDGGLQRIALAIVPISVVIAVLSGRVTRGGR